MGKIEIDHTGSGGGITLSSDGTSLLLGGSAVGGGAALELYDENPSTPTAPSATGTNAVAIGYGSTASSTESVAIGDSTSSGINSIAIGENSTSSGNRSTAIGRNSFSGSADATAVGAYSIATTGSYANAFGHHAYSYGQDGTSIGRAYSSGTDSFAAAIANNSSSYGAQQTSSIAIGKQAKATGAYGTAIGEATQATASNSVCIGYYSQATAQGAVALGYDAQATAAKAFAFGLKVRNPIENSFKFAGGNFAAAGDAQGGMYILRADTTDATATVLTTDNTTPGTTDQIVAASDTCIMFSGTLVAMQNGAQDQGGWEIKGLLKNDGGTTTLVSSNIQTFDDGNGWVVALTADNTNNALAITCTGEASHNIRWVANIQTSEVTYA
jgi:trimeric autotransporter adhesin